MTDYEQHHTDAKYTTSDVDPSEFVPEEFDYDETLDLRSMTNYLFADDDGNRFRVSVKKDTFLFTVSFYAKNESEGYSCSFPARDESQLQNARDYVLETVGLA